MKTEPAQVKVDTDEIAELSHIGAGHAATALASLVGRTIWIEVPIVCENAAAEAKAGAGAGDATPGTEWSTGAFFEFDGCFDALVGLLFPRQSAEMMVRSLTGAQSGEVSPDVIEPALMEVGNILASHLASAIADALAGRLLPSIPTLVMSGAETALEEWVDAHVDRSGIRIEIGLHDASGELRGRVVVIPTGTTAAR